MIHQSVIITHLKLFPTLLLALMGSHVTNQPNHQNEMQCTLFLCCNSTFPHAQFFSLMLQQCSVYGVVGYRHEKTFGLGQEKRQLS